MAININDIVARKARPKKTSDQSDLNDMLGQSPETGFLQKNPPPTPTPTPQPKKTNGKTKTSIS